MLTVNIKSCGRELIHEVKEVHAVSNNSSEAIDEVFVHRPNGDIDRINSGDVFVMSESGKTVARYLLSMPPKEAACGES